MKKYFIYAINAVTDEIYPTCNKTNNCLPYVEFANTKMGYTGLGYRTRCLKVG